MQIRKIFVPSFAFALALGLAGLAGALPEAPAAAPEAATQESPKSCCKHHVSAEGKAGMHCGHAKMTAEGEKGEGCCARHGAMHKDGAAADGKACCAKHAEMMKGDASGDGKAGCAEHAQMMKGDATADGKACCAHHAAMHKDGDKSSCCCSGAGKACPHPAAAEAPAKS